MKKFLLLLAIVAMTGTLFISTGCEEEDPPVVNVGPSMDFTDTDPTGLNGPYPTTDVETDDPDATLYVGLSAVTGTGQLQSLTISEDGTKLATARMTIRDLNDGSAITANNPLLITGVNVDGFLLEIGIDVSDELATKEYTFELVDENGESTTLSISVTTVEPPDPIEMTLEGVLLNQAGPAGQGGLDLDDGPSTGTIDASAIDAEIKDEGIDLALPTASNWKRQISAINDSEIRVPATDQLPEGFDFANVTTKVEIRSLYDGGDQLPNTDGTGELVSDPVEVGDYFFVKRGDRYYLLIVKEVNPTTNNNMDNIVFDVKY